MLAVVFASLATIFSGLEYFAYAHKNLDCILDEADEWTGVPLPTILFFLDLFLVVMYDFLCYT